MSARSPAKDNNPLLRSDSPGPFDSVNINTEMTTGNNTGTGTGSGTGGGDISPAGTPPNTDQDHPLSKSNNITLSTSPLASSAQSPLALSAGRDSNSSGSISTAAAATAASPSRAAATSSATRSSTAASISSPSSSASTAAPLAAWISEQLAELSLSTPIDNFEISVSDPEKKGDGLYSAHITYKVNSTINGKSSTVVRRFSDFVWLHDILTSNSRYSGLLVPALPDKAMLGRFVDEFVEERRRGLELFLKRLLQHPQLKTAEETILFISGSESALTAAKSAKPAGNNNNNKDSISGTVSSTDSRTAAAASTAGVGSAPAKKSGFMSFFKEGIQSISASFSSGKDRSKTADDIACDRVLEYATTLESEFTNLHTHIESLGKRDRELKSSWSELGLSNAALGGSESAVGSSVLSVIFTSLGSAADQLTSLTEHKYESSSVHFREPIKDFIRQSEALKLLIKSRSALQSQYYSALNQLESKQAQLSKNSNSVPAASIELSQSEVDNKFSELTIMTNKIRIEFARFQTEKQSILKSASIAFVKQQISYAKAVQQVMESVLPEMENTESK